MAGLASVWTDYSPSSAFVVAAGSAKPGAQNSLSVAAYNTPQLFSDHKATATMKTPGSNDTFWLLVRSNNANQVGLMGQQGKGLSIVTAAGTYAQIQANSVIQQPGPVITWADADQFVVEARGNCYNVYYNGTFLFRWTDTAGIYAPYASDGNHRQVAMAYLASATVPPAGPSYDSVGSGVYGTGATGTWTHTATAGDYVMAFLGPYEYVTAPAASNAPTIAYGSTDGTINTGTKMTYLGQCPTSVANYGLVSAWGLANVAGGAKTLAYGGGSWSGPGVFNSIAFKSVNSVGAMNSTGGNGTPCSQNYASLPANQLVVQAFGYEYVPTASQPQVPSGGTNVYNYLPSGSGYGGLIINYSTAAATTFATTPTQGYSWSGAMFILS